MDRRQELTKEVRRARGWLIAVGVIMFVSDLVFLYVVYGDQVTEANKIKYTAIGAGVLLVFLALAYFTARKPVLCLVLGLVVFWAIQIINAIDNPSSLTDGLIIKAFFTYALVRGLRNASRAKELLKELGEVFE